MPQILLGLYILCHLDTIIPTSKNMSNLKYYTILFFMVTVTLILPGVLLYKINYYYNKIEQLKEKYRSNPSLKVSNLLHQIDILEQQAIVHTKIYGNAKIIESTLEGIPQQIIIMILLLTMYVNNSIFCIFFCVENWCGLLLLIGSLPCSFVSNLITYLQYINVNRKDHLNVKSVIKFKFNYT